MWLPIALATTTGVCSIALMGTHPKVAIAATQAPTYLCTFPHFNPTLSTGPRKPMTTHLRRKRLAALIQTGLALLLAAAPAAAATFTVTTALDSPTGSGTSGSLRYLIGQAGNGDTLEFSCAALACPVTLPVQMLGNNGGFPGPTAYLIKSKAITIAAPNPGDVTLQA